VTRLRLHFPLERVALDEGACVLHQVQDDVCAAPRRVRRFCGRDRVRAFAVRRPDRRVIGTRPARYDLNPKWRRIFVRAHARRQRCRCATRDDRLHRTFRYYE
jgi:hypothetical protein